VALKVALVSAGVFIGVVAGAALGIHAADESDMGGGADLTGVDGSGQGSMVSADAVPDLTVESSSAQQSEPPPGIWDKLAGCEAGGDWHNARNPIYKGGLQFDAPTWARHGGLEFAWRADFATRAQQIIVAERTLAAQGWSAWPRCSRLIGVR